MGSIDFDSPLAETYITQVRQFERAGKQPRRRAAVDRGEALRAREVRRRVDRLTMGYQAQIEGPAWQGPETCSECGGTIAASSAALPWRCIYTKSGRVDLYRCERCG